MKVIHEGSTQGMMCPSCNWSVVTTRIPEIQLDFTSYEVRISGGDYHNEKHVKALAKIANINFLAARKLLQEEQPLVYAGKASDIVKIREALIVDGLQCAITPDFRW